MSSPARRITTWIRSSVLLVVGTLVTIGLVPSSRATAPLGAVARWAGQNNTTDIVNHHNGTFHGGAHYAVGKVGTAFRFNATNWVEVAPTAALSPGTDTLTVDMWVRQGQVPGVLVDHRNDAGEGFRLLTSGASGDAQPLQLAVGDLPSGGGTGSVILANGTKDVGDNTWHHVGAVVTSAGAKLYVDGVLDVSAPWSFPPGGDTRDGIDTSGTPFAIGADLSNNGTPTSELTGRLDEVEYFHRAVTLAEIKQAARRPAVECGPEENHLLVGVDFGMQATIKRHGTGWTVTRPNAPTTTSCGGYEGPQVFVEGELGNETLTLYLPGASDAEIAGMFIDLKAGDEDQVHIIGTPADDVVLVGSGGINLGDGKVITLLGVEILVVDGLGGADGLNAQGGPGIGTVYGRSVKFLGGDGRDFLAGTAKADYLNGGDGRDRCQGHGGGDTILHCEEH
jgi:Ca2+-binding RTX toxin-like protein